MWSRRVKTDLDREITKRNNTGPKDVKIRVSRDMVTMSTIWSTRNEGKRTGDLDPRGIEHRGPRYRTWYRGTDIKVTGLNGHGPRDRHWKPQDRLRWLQVMANSEVWIVVTKKMWSEPVWPLARGATDVVVLVASERQHRILYTAVGLWLGT
jgi:hypothetical protein